MRSESVGHPDTNMMCSVTVGTIRMREEDFREKALVTRPEVTFKEDCAGVLERKSAL
jgi:hypothetical protein